MAGQQQSQKKGKGNRKLGRNKVKCQRYTAEDRRYKHKLRRVQKAGGRVSDIRHFGR